MEGGYEKAISIANGTDFALVAGIYTRDFSKAWRASREIDAGVIFVNNYNRNFLGTPFGGSKHSGYGREPAHETLREFGHTKLSEYRQGLAKYPNGLRCQISATPRSEEVEIGRKEER